MLIRKPSSFYLLSLLACDLRYIHSFIPTTPAYGGNISNQFKSKSRTSAAKRYGFMDQALQQSTSPNEQSTVASLESRRKTQESASREMPMVPVFAFLFSISVLFGLSLSGEVEGSNAAATRALQNVVDKALPMDTLDVFCIAIGEAIGGALGTLATWAATSIVSLQNGSKASLVKNTIVNADYFLTRAAAYPLLDAIGVPPFLASLATVLISTVPSEITRLLKNEKKNDVAEKESKFGDLPEVFGDVTKWLEYDVLKETYGGQIEFCGRFLGDFEESTVFGLLAGLSSQLYLDAIDRYSEAEINDGDDDSAKSNKNKRTASDTAKQYARKCLESATLFGVYEAVKLPVGLMLTAFLAGSFDGCLDSVDYILCRETYITANPQSSFLDASPDAQLRSIAVSVYSLWNRFQPGF